MEQTLTNLWAKFKKLVWWKKLLILLPLPVILIAVILFIAWRAKEQGDVEAAVDYGREQVDARIADKVEQDQKLAAKDKELAERQQELHNEIKQAEQDAARTNSDIVNAANGDDITDLIRIHKQLNSKQRRGAAPIRFGVTRTDKNK